MTDLPTACEASVESPPRPVPPSACPRLPLRQGLGLMLVGFSVLLYELVITRVFSSLLAYHFSFFAVSTALLGLGLSGLRHRILWRRDPEMPARRLLLWCTAQALATVAFMFVSFCVPLRFSTDTTGLLVLLALLALSAVPFFFAGLVVCHMFNTHVAHAGRVYFFDLMGGAIACLVMVTLMNHVGPVASLLICALATCVGGFLMSPGRQLRLPAAATATGVSFLLVVQLATGFIQMDHVYFGLGGKLLPINFDVWNAFSRISVIKHPAPQVQLIIDTGADTWVWPADKQPWYPSDLAFSAAPGGRYIIIGPGGGPDVRCALAHNPAHLDLVEINSSIVNLMTGIIREFSGNIYTDPRVKVHVEDGRSFMDRSRDVYDVCVLTLVDTYAAVSAASYSLTENNLYTVEALQSYLRHLRPDGMLVISRWDFEAVRLMCVLHTALRGMGVQDPYKHVLVTSSRDNQVLTAFVSPTPFNETRKAAIMKEAGQRGLMTFHSPDMKGDANLLAQVLHAQSLQPIIDAAPIDLSPTFDDRPFFFFFWKARGGTPGMEGLAAGRDAALRQPMLLLGILFLLGLVLSLAVGGAGARAMRLPGHSPGWAVLYFAGLGIGFMVLEMCFIQRFVLFLGHPVYAIATSLFTVLLCGALGSALSERIPEARLEAWRTRILVGVALAGVLVAYAYPVILKAFLGSPLEVRLAVASALIAPVGILLGMPFPLGMRGAATGGDDASSWMWAINGTTSVLGSVMATLSAIFIGFSNTILLGAAIYAATAACSRFMCVDGEKGNKEAPE